MLSDPSTALYLPFLIQAWTLSSLMLISISASSSSSSDTLVDDGVGLLGGHTGLSGVAVAAVERREGRTDVRETS